MGANIWFMRPFSSLIPSSETIINMQFPFNVDSLELLKVALLEGSVKLAIFDKDFDSDNPLRIILDPEVLNKAFFMIPKAVSEKMTPNSTISMEVRYKQTQPEGTPSPELVTRQDIAIVGKKPVV